MADYGSWPLRDADGDNIDPANLPISPGLRDALYDWERRCDEILNHNDPRRSGFKTPEAEAAFNADGQALLERLQAELGDGHAVTLQLW